MFGFVRKAADRMLHVIARELPERSRISAFQQLRKRGASRYRSRAAAYFISNFHDSLFHDARRKAENVAAYRVRRFSDERRRRQFAHIARVLKVIDQARAHSV